MTQLGIDNALDRLFRTKTAEQLAEIPEPEQLATRFEGMPQKFQQPEPIDVKKLPVVSEEQLQQPPPPPPPPPPPRRGAGGEVLSPEMFQEVPDMFKFVRSYFIKQGWDWKGEDIQVDKPDGVEARAERRRLLRTRRSKAFGAFQQKYGMVETLKQEASVAELFFQPAKLLRPGQKFTKLDVGITVLDVLPGVGATFKGIKTGGKSLAEAAKVIDLISEVGKAKKETAALGVVHIDAIVNEVLDVVRKSPEMPKIPLKQKISDAITVVEEQLTDKFAGINKMAARNRAKYGGKLPYAIDAETQTALLPGVSYEAKQMSQNTFNAVTDAVGRDKGLLEYVDSYLILRHQRDVLANHPERVFMAGKKTVAEIDNALLAMQKDLGDELFTKVFNGAKIVKKHYGKLLDLDVETGLITPELRTVFNTQYSWYNPIQYYRAELESLTKGSWKPISVGSTGFKRLSELGTEAVQERPLNTLLEATLNRMAVIRRNEAARSIVKLAEVDDQFKKIVKLLDITGELTEKEALTAKMAKIAGRVPREFPKHPEGVISFFEEGRKLTYKVPQMLEKEAKFLADIGFSNIEKVAMAVDSVSRTAITGANPVFFIGNFGIDTLTAILTKGISPLRIAKRLLLNLRDIVKEDKLLRDLRLSRGEVTGFSGINPRELADKARKSGQLVLENAQDWKRILNPQNIVDTLEKIGHAVEMSPRSAVFEKAIAKGLPLEEAALAARRVTIDFSRSGTAIRHANALWLYLNAGVQGSLIPFRALRDNPISRYMISGLTGLTIANYGWNRQFPEYEDVPNWAKYGAMVVMLPSEEYDTRGNKVPHYITVIPNMREFSFFTAPVIYALRKLDKKAPEGIDSFLSDFGRQLNPLSSIIGEGGGIEPPTQVGATLKELQTNYDPFRDRPIVPAEFEGKPVEEQYDQFTSHTARKVGELIGYSPFKLDYAIKGIFVGLGTTVISGMDAVIRYLDPPDVSPRIADLYRELQDIRPPEVSPDDVKRKRNEFLYSLPAEDREALLKMEREPGEVIRSEE